VLASDEQMAADPRLADSQARAEAVVAGRASRGAAHHHVGVHRVHAANASATRAHAS
jgi:hypothetical protein